MNTATSADEAPGDGVVARCELPPDSRAPLSSQVTPPLTALDPEAVAAAAVRTPDAGVLEQESAVMIPLRAMFVAFVVGCTVALASFVVLVVWYRLLPEPEKILLTAVPRARRVGAADNVAGTTKSSATPAVVEIIQYVGVPQTYLPDNWSHSSDASFRAMSSSPYGASLVQLTTQENSTNSSVPP